MSKFNNPVPGIKTINNEGHAAYNMAVRAKLVTQVLTSFFNEAKFYGDNSAEMQKLIPTVIQTDPEFVSNLAVFSRREFHMRSVSHVLTAFLAHEPEGKAFVRETVRGVSLRGDDVTEIMAFYLDTFGKPIPNALKRGISDVLTGFDEYTLAKYRGDGHAVKMRDLLCLCRPAPKTEEQAALWKRCLEGELAVPQTWETELSSNGNNAKTWKRLIDSGKVGYMALLRNLRNIILAGPKNIEKVYQKLSDPEAVRQSKQLPFRFLSAYKELSKVPQAGSRAFDALETAVSASVENLPRLPGTTVIAVDTSGSMGSPISAKSKIRCCEIGMLLGLIANRICDNSIFYTFDTTIKKVGVPRYSGILYAATHESRACGVTKMELPFQQMLHDHIQADRLIIISDNECNSPYFSKPIQSLADEYRRYANSELWVHAIDLLGYGTQQFHGAKTNIIAGWSEKVFDFILLAEQGEGSLERTIAKYKWK